MDKNQQQDTQEEVITNGRFLYTLGELQREIEFSGDEVYALAAMLEQNPSLWHDGPEAWRNVYEKFHRLTPELIRAGTGSGQIQTGV